MKKSRRWLLLLFINLILIVAILEIGLRLSIGRSFPPRFFEPHPDFGHFHRPNVEGWQRTGEYESYVRINSKGLRDREFSYEKPDGVYRILVIGDSFTEGLQVEIEETFPKQLETLLNASFSVEVINAGVSRYGTDNALLFLENEGLKYQPDLVIYAFYTNDITDNVENGLFTLENGELIQQPVEISRWEAIRGFFYDVSCIYRVGYAVSLRISQQTDETLIDTDWGLVLPVYRAELKPREVEAWDITAALLQRMADSAANANADLMVVYLPENIQTEDTLWVEVESASEPLDRDAPNKKLAEIIPDNVQFVDLSQPFRERGQDTRFYYETDGHFNPAGHRLTAELLADIIPGE